MSPQIAPAPILEVPAHASLDAVLASAQPAVIRGLVSDWPLVAASRDGDEQAVGYLKRYANDALPAIATLAPPGARFFYDGTFQGFNFRREPVALTAALNTLLRDRARPDAPTIYLGATTCDTFLPGLCADNPLDLGGRDALASIWIGNRSRVPAHQDLPDNLACVAAGRRRFLLFPPEQLSNLYVGPLDVTPAGQPVSLVDPSAPDLERFPRYAEAMRHAQAAVLDPGDALFIPSMWWHHIEALAPFNVLLNYWWRASPAYMDAPVNALMLAILCLRDLPPEQRAAWQETFRHYVFEFDAEQAAGHIPEHARHALGTLDAGKAARLRAHLLRNLMTPDGAQG